MSTSASTARPAWAWVDRLRFVIATALVWAALHLVPGLLLPHSHERPLVFASGVRGIGAAIAMIAVVWVGAAAATLVTGAAVVRTPLLVVGFALALWAGEGGRLDGTMDDWLIAQQPQPGPPRGGAYAVLLIDYVFLLVALLGAYAVAAVLTARAKGASAPAGSILREATAAWRDRAQLMAGGRATLLAALLAGCAVFVLSGRFLDETYRPQVYFAVWVGVMLGVYLARQLLHVQDPFWYWPVPFVVGIVGLVVAVLRPGLLLPAGFRTDIIPAWGLARALPIEMVGIGLVGSLWILRPGRANPHGDV